MELSHSFLFICLVAVGSSQLQQDTNPPGSSSQDSVPKFVYVQFQEHAPQIVIAPLDHTVIYNSRITFYCRANGHPTPEVYWTRADRRLRDGRNRYFAQTPYASSLTLESANDKVGGEYSCVAENGIGRPAIANATLTVYAEGQAKPEGFPELTAFARETVVVELGFPLRLTCSFRGEPQPEVQWYKNKVPVDIEANSKMSIATNRSDPTSFDLLISETVDADAGLYECMGRNERGTAFSSVVKVYVRVRHYPPMFTARPQQVNQVMAGGGLNLTCTAVGSPMPVVRWMRSGAQLGVRENEAVGRNILVLTNIQESANYTCRAASDLGTIELTTEVKVEALPDAPTNVLVNSILPNSAVVQWSAPPSPKDRLAATVDTEYVVQFRSKYADKMTEEWSDRGEEEIRKGLTYKLNGLQPYSYYEVRIVPFSKFGRGTPSQPVDFRTGETAPGSPPLQVRAKAVSRNSAMVQWNEPALPNGQILEYNIYYTLASSNQPVEQWMLMTASRTVAVITGLQPDQIYAVSVQARTAVGVGPLSDPIQFIMIQGVPLAPRNLQVVETTATSITLAWDRPEGTDSILSYEIYINNSRTRQPTVRSVVPPTETRFILEDLYPNTVYNIRVTARSASGEGPHTPTIQQKTNEAEPSAPPLNIRARLPNLHISRTLTVSWEPPSDQLANGRLIGYKLYYVAKYKADDQSTVIDINGGSAQEYTLTGLEVWTEYKIWMTASTTVGEGPASQPIIARTGEDVPEAPKFFNVRALNSSTINITWKKPVDREANGEIRGYQIYISRVDENNVRVGEPRRIEMLDGNAESVLATGLEPRTRYMINMQAFTLAGDGSLTKPKIVETLGSVPTAPQNVRLSLIESEPIRVRVTWEAPREAHGPIKSYRLIWGRKGEAINSKTASLSADRLSFVADSMLKGSEYEFKLQAQNDVNYGETAIEFYRTEDGVPSGMPENITVSYHSPTSARVSWAPPLERLRNGVITMYQVRYQDRDNAIDLRADNTSETAIILANLRPGAKYNVQVVAFTSAGAGPVSHRITYNTDQSERPTAPQSVLADRINSTAISVRWTPPSVAIRGYKIYYSTKDNGVDVSGWTTVPIDEPVTTWIIHGLDPTSAYAIKVQAVGLENEAGELSAEAIVNTVIDDRFQQEMVQNFESFQVTATTVHLRWQAPLRPAPFQYKIEHDGQPSTGGDRHTIPPILMSSSAVERVLDGLKPGYTYTIHLSVQYTNEPSWVARQTITVPTKQLSAPQLMKSAGAATIALPREDNDFRQIYVIVVASSEKRPPTSITMAELQADRSRRSAETKPYIAAAFPGNQAPTTLILGDAKEYGTYTNKELVPGFVYKAFIRAVLGNDEYFSSVYSSDFTSDGPYLETSVEAISTEPTKVPLIVGPVGGGLVIILIITIIVVVVKRKNTQKKEKAPDPIKVVHDHPPTYPNDPVELRRMNFSTPGMQSHPPIPITQLANHIEQLRAHDNIKFSQEYESIDPGQHFTWDNSNMEYNKPKNRYANVIAYDFSRVVLQSIEGVLGSDYINANYMDGYRKQNAYISTQGPLPETFGDFWRMVWEQRCATIVMMTKLEERARIKCDQYWPMEGSEQYGPIVVQHSDTMELATYTVRTFFIERDGWPERREVRQYQFTAWPDHGVPDYPTPLLIFMRRVKAATPSDAGPMVVHCSAGVGRTGAFIVIDAMLERIKHEKTVDIYGHVTCLRAQRNYMVQTEDQYIFIHDALLEAVQGGNTEVQAKSLYTHIQKLSQPEADGTVTGLEVEFKKLSNMKPSNPSRFVSANQQVNKFKNRLVNILPYESNRVCLQPIRGVEGSDYINASFIDGYRFRKAYIATQGPLAETVEDFWRMMWEHNSTIVVMLTKLREMGRDKCHQYWPDARSARYQYFVVDPHAEYNMPDYVLREFKVTDARDGQSRTIRLFQFNDWPEQGVPKSGMSFIQFIGQVHKTKEQFGQEGPITVHCSTGAGRTGVFIALSIVLERMRYEGVIDMFHTVKMLRTQRQGMVQSEDQYQFCYNAALEHLSSYDNY